jgi:FkbM family methyltransferase
MAALPALVRPGMVILDIGSHLGYFTLALAQLTGPTGRVYSFEPLPAHVTLLQRTLARNHLPQITLVPQAVGEQTGSVTLEERANASMTRVANGRTRWGQQYVQANMTTLDDWATQTNLPRLDLIKLDIEGHELAALRGASQLLRQFRPAIICELHRGDGVPYRPAEVVDWLVAADYTPSLLPANPHLPLAEAIARLAATQPAPGWMSVLHLLATPNP